LSGSCVVFVSSSLSKIDLYSTLNWTFSPNGCFVFARRSCHS
jgi:hypothetical protein